MITCPICGSHVELEDNDEPDSELWIFEEFSYGEKCLSENYPVNKFVCLEKHTFFMNPSEDTGDTL